MLKNCTGILSTDILDKDGNIVHYQPYTKNYNIYEIEFLALISGILGFISLLVSIIVKFKNNKR
ncbi:hypothetical protein QOZ84_03570 [Romboutsia sedimentorum]|uniref:Uncharacterized protein n=1 Tax=Romboutsia sedimentorum TaxID=1368474 RepID=A0ABT7E6V8_9FIRM|nr:hypothetical protein [Romboutsia sedimentorum]MDK2562617.1 hypothetical protein [Romboutsia sedimentorum]MDK2584859.1 hypothetical protein [Romboutsia sedimentorum]